MKFSLVFSKSGYESFRQYNNLRDWLDSRKIKYQFDWDFSGSYYPSTLIIENEEDATAFSLSMKHVVST